MERKELIFFFTAISVAIIALWYLGLYFSLYWVLWWYDVVMHFLGGFWIGLIIYILFLYGEKENFSSRVNLLLAVIMGIFLVGVMWEWFELEKGLASFETEDYFVDTIIDLIVDLLGALSAYYLVLNWKKIK